jgi:hypothetical protein
MRQMSMPVAFSPPVAVPFTVQAVALWQKRRRAGGRSKGTTEAPHKWFLAATARAAIVGCAGALLGAFIPPGAYAQSSVETIVLVRHGEKPDKGLGQLNCKGLNRSLALPRVLSGQFGKPDYIFAPNPSKQKLDSGVLYDYVRPLATIEPTAIAAGLPVDTRFGYKKIKALEKELEKQRYRSALIFVAWEHTEIISIARDIMAGNGGDPSLVPKWQGNDFDGIYVLRLTRAGNATTAAFERKTEGLDNTAEACPQ